MLLCSHALAEVERHVDRVAVMHRGHLLAPGTLPELRRGIETEVRIDVRVRPCTTAQLLAVLPPGVRWAERSDAGLLGLLVADQGRVVDRSALDVLLLNPADVYRLFNMTASETVWVYSGMAGPGDRSALPPPVFLAALAAWMLLPFGLAVLAFRKRPL